MLLSDCSDDGEGAEDSGGEYELQELELEPSGSDCEEAEGRRDGLPAAGKAELDLRMDRLPPGQSCQEQQHDGRDGLLRCPSLRLCPSRSACCCSDGGSAPPSSLRVSGSARHTGPKGVMADFAEAQQNLRSLRLREAMARQRQTEQRTADLRHIAQPAQQQQRRQRGEAKVTPPLPLPPPCSRAAAAERR